MRRYTPRPDEIAVVRLAPGDFAVVVTLRGDYRVHGEDSAHGELAGERVAFVPFDPVAVGWGSSTSAVIHAAGRATMAALRRMVRGHKLDDEVWHAARLALRTPGACVYVQQVSVPRYNSTRWAATAVRLHQEENP